MKLLYTTLLALSLCTPAVAQVAEPEYGAQQVTIGPCQSSIVMTQDSARAGYNNVYLVGDDERPLLKIFTRDNGDFMVHFIMDDNSECHAIEGQNLTIVPVQIVPSDPT